MGQETLSTGSQNSEFLFRFLARFEKSFFRAELSFLRKQESSLFGLLDPRFRGGDGREALARNERKGKLLTLADLCIMERP